MTGFERIMAAIRFERPDLQPVIPQIFGHAAMLQDVPLRDYCRDGETLAKCQLNALAHYQYDTVFAVTDAGVEAEALGAKLEYRDNLYPFVSRPAFAGLAGVPSVRLPNPLRDGRMPEILRSLGCMRREVGDTTLVAGLVLGPTTLAIQLLGIEAAFYGAADSPEDFEKLLDFCVDVQKVYGQAQLEAGAHLVIIFDPGASPELVPPAFFREIELPRVGEMFRFFKEKGAAASWLHIAGQAERILPYYSSVGVDIANFDYPTSAETARDLLPRTCVDGNIKPLAFIEESPDKISEYASGLMDTFRARGGFILSSGCEIPPGARPENVHALVEAARRG